jgi:HAD superfamily hydrolase (TIGR01509 family)
MTEIRAITFDLEGTLVDVEAAHHLGHLKVAESLGLNLTLEAAYERIPGFVGGGDEAIARELRRLSGSSKRESEILESLKKEYHRRLVDFPIIPRPGSKEFIESVRTRRVPYAIGSLTPRDEAQYLLRSAGLEALFADIPKIFREDVKFVKPNPEVYRVSAHSLGVLPSEQLVFEDSAAGVQAAVLAGSQVVAVPTAAAASLDFKALGAMMMLRDWRDLDTSMFIARFLTPA